MEGPLRQKPGMNVLEGCREEPMGKPCLQRTHSCPQHCFWYKGEQQLAQLLGNPHPALLPIYYCPPSQLQLVPRGTAQFPLCFVILSGEFCSFAGLGWFCLVCFLGQHTSWEDQIKMHHQLHFLFLHCFLPVLVFSFSFFVDRF